MAWFSIYLTNAMENTKLTKKLSFSSLRLEEIDFETFVSECKKDGRKEYEMLRRIIHCWAENKRMEAKNKVG